MDSFSAGGNANFVQARHIVHYLAPTSFAVCCKRHADNASQHNMKYVKSKQRVADHGEVLTPPWLVEAMLSDAQKKVIALDYGMRDGKASITVRKALLYYTLKRLGLDTAPSTPKPANQQIVLLNREVFDGVA